MHDEPDSGGAGVTTSSSARLALFGVAALAIACGNASPSHGGGMGGAAGVAGVAAAGGAPGQGGTSRSDAGGRGGAGPGGGSTTDGAAGETGASPSGDATDAGEAGDLSDGGETGAGVISSFQNGVFWTDVAGNRIEAHGAGFIKVGTTWYWVGEDRSQNSGAFRGMNLYASTDLSKWEFRHTLITRATVPDLNVAGRIIERPKLIHNDTTGQFVMWLHWDGNNYADAATAVFSSSTIDGDYVYHASFRPNANMSRDDTLFKDDDGSAYFISAANNNADLIIYQLTADYLDIARQVVTLWPGSFREAPAMFKANGRYFLISSGATGWDPNQARYASATSVAGPWSALQNLGDSTTYDTQSAYVISLEGRQGTTYIYAGDRWQDPDLVSSKYIWLPLTQNAATLRLDYHDQWRVNVTTGLVVP